MKTLGKNVIAGHTVLYIVALFRDNVIIKSHCNRYAPEILNVSTTNLIIKKVLLLIVL